MVNDESRVKSLPGLFFWFRIQVGPSCLCSWGTVGSLCDCDCHPYFLKRLKVSLVSLKKVTAVCNLHLQIFWIQDVTERIKGPLSLTVENASLNLDHIVPSLTNFKLFHSSKQISVRSWILSYSKALQCVSFRVFSYTKITLLPVYWVVIYEE